MARGSRPRRKRPTFHTTAVRLNDHCRTYRADPLAELPVQSRKPCPLALCSPLTFTSYLTLSVSRLEGTSRREAKASFGRRDPLSLSLTAGSDKRIQIQKPSAREAANNSFLTPFKRLLPCSRHRKVATGFYCSRLPRDRPTFFSTGQQRWRNYFQPSS